MDDGGEIEWRTCPSAEWNPEGSTLSRGGALLRAFAPPPVERASRTVVRGPKDQGPSMKVRAPIGSELLASGMEPESDWFPAAAEDREGAGGQQHWADDEADQAGDEHGLGKGEPPSGEEDAARESDLLLDDGGPGRAAALAGGTRPPAGTGAATRALDAHERVTYDAGRPWADTGRRRLWERTRRHVLGAWWRREAVLVSMEAGLVEMTAPPAARHPSSGPGDVEVEEAGGRLWTIHNGAPGKPALDAAKGADERDGLVLGRPATRVLRPSWSPAGAPTAAASRIGKERAARGGSPAFSAARCVPVAAASSLLPVVVALPALVLGAMALAGGAGSGACPPGVSALPVWAVVFGAVGIAAGAGRAAAVGSLASSGSATMLEAAVAASFANHGVRLALAAAGAVALVVALPPLAAGASLTSPAAAASVLGRAAACGGVIPVLGCAAFALLLAGLYAAALGLAVYEAAAGPSPRDDADARYILDALRGAVDPDVAALRSDPQPADPAPITSSLSRRAAALGRADPA